MVAARENERALQGQIRDPESVARAVAIADVDAAKALAADPALNTEELFARCFALKGEPLNQASARRDMRERTAASTNFSRCGKKLSRANTRFIANRQRRASGRASPSSKHSAAHGSRRFPRKRKPSHPRTSPAKRTRCSPSSDATTSKSNCTQRQRPSRWPTSIRSGTATDTRTGCSRAPCSRSATRPSRCSLSCAHDKRHVTRNRA